LCGHSACRKVDAVFHGSIVAAILANLNDAFLVSVPRAMLTEYSFAMLAREIDEVIRI
jgi:hypothetical protein